MANINVKRDFGAVGDGLYDDTEAFRLAISNVTALNASINSITVEKQKSFFKYLKGMF